MKTFCTCALAILFLAVNSQALDWDVSLDMDQNPWSDTPAWSGRGNLVVAQLYFGTRVWGEPEGADGYYRELHDVFTNALDTIYFELSGANFDPDFTAGFTCEARFRIHNGTIPGSHSIIASSDGDGGTTEDGSIIIGTYYRFASQWEIGVRLGTGSGTTDFSLLDFYDPLPGGPTGWLPTPWITARAVVDNGTIKFYVNGELLHTDSGLASHATANEELIFGDLSGGAAGSVDYDYIRVQYDVRDPLPDFQSVALEDVMAFEVDTSFGLEYRLEASTDGGTNYNDVGFIVIGTGSTVNMYDPAGTDTSKLYRVTSP